MNTSVSNINALKEYVDTLSKEMALSCFEGLDKLAQMLLKTKENGAHIYIIGNGGSAATASHMANDLVKGCRVGDNTGLRAIAITDPVPVITCLANDFSYEEVYSLQLQTHAQAGDILIAFSGSGNSPNILHAVKTARELGLQTVGFSGADGGKLKELCDISVLAPSDCMERIEDIHLLYEHALVSVIREQLSCH